MHPCMSGRLCSSLRLPVYMTFGRSAKPEAADALDGLDPVLLVGGKEVPGKSAFSVTRGDFVYLFSTADTKATFESDPAQYEIQLGGLCARMGKTAGGNPSDFIVHEGKIYVFGSDECHKKFQADPAKYLGRHPPPPPGRGTSRCGARQLVIDRAVAAIGGAGRRRWADELHGVLHAGAEPGRKAKSRSRPRPCGAFPIAPGRNAQWCSRARRCHRRPYCRHRECGSSAARDRRIRCDPLAGPASNRTSDDIRLRCCVHDAARRSRRSPSARPRLTTSASKTSASSAAPPTYARDRSQRPDPQRNVPRSKLRGRARHGQHRLFGLPSDRGAAAAVHRPGDVQRTAAAASLSVTIDAIAINTPLDPRLFAPKRRVSGDIARGLGDVALLAVILPTTDRTWPQWGGPVRNFVAPSRARLATTWPADGPRRLWQRPIGAGYSAIVTDGRTLYTLFRDGSADVAIALDAATGATVWEARYEAPFVETCSERLGPVPRAAPLIAGDR